MMTIEKTVRELRRRIEAAGFREITLTMACNGDKVTVSPCYSGYGTPASFDQVEYYLVYSPSLPWLGGADGLRRVGGAVFLLFRFLQGRLRTSPA